MGSNASNAQGDDAWGLGLRDVQGLIRENETEQKVRNQLETHTSRASGDLASELA